MSNEKNLDLTDIGALAAHTKEPWEWSSSHNVGPEAGSRVLTAMDYARAAACVNACADVDSDALAALPGGLSGFLELASQCATGRKALRALNAELVAALKDARETFRVLGKQTTLARDEAMSACDLRIVAALAKVQA